MASPDVQMMQQYMQLLFNPGELVCPSNDARDTDIFTVEDLIEAGVTTEFVCVNPFKPGTRRLDENVQTFRNILIEIDDLPIKEQERVIERTFGLPYSTKTFSGGKSYHYVLSFEEPFVNQEEYRVAAQQILDVITIADSKCKNPSRFTRMAGALRADKGDVLQKMYGCKGRISAGEFQAFLTKHEDILKAAKAKRDEVMSKVSVVSVEDLPEGTKGRLSLRTKKYLKEGSTNGSRNDDLFFAACDFKNNLFEMETALEQLVPVAKASGLTNWEINQAIKSAYRTAGIRPRVV